MLEKGVRKVGVYTTAKRFLKDKLVELSRLKNVDVIKNEKSIREGWCGKPKGMLHILYERGHIDKSLVTNPRIMRYSNKGENNDFDKNGIIKEEYKKYSLTHLLSNCKDVMNEKTDLQHLCDNLGNSISSNHSILFTPKFHC